MECSGHDVEGGHEMWQPTHYGLEEGPEYCASMGERSDCLNCISS